MSPSARSISAAQRRDLIAEALPVFEFLDKSRFGQVVAYFRGPKPFDRFGVLRDRTPRANIHLGARRLVQADIDFVASVLLRGVDRLAREGRQETVNEGVRVPQGKQRRR